MCTEKQFIWLTIHTHHEAKPDCGLIHVATFILNAAQTMLACLWSQHFVTIKYTKINIFELQGINFKIKFRFLCLLPKVLYFTSDKF